MNSKRSEFLAYVEIRVSEDPELAAYISDYVAMGLRNAVKQANERATDFESALLAVKTPRFPNRDSFVRGKIRKWLGKSSLNWARVIGDMK